MTLEQLRAALREKHGALPEIKAKGRAEAATDADVQAYGDIVKAIEKLNEQIDTAEREEAIEAKSAKPAEKVTATVEEKLPAQVAVKDPLEFYCLTAAAVFKAKKTMQSVQDVLENEGYGQIVQKLLLAPRNQKVLNTLVSADGGILVPAAQVGANVFDLLRVESTFINAGPTRIPLVNGQFKQGTATSGATASYVGEGGKKPVSTPQFSSITMASKKLAGIVLMTDEMVRWSAPDLAAYVRNDLQASMATTMDLNMWLGAGTGSTPTGVLIKSGIQTVTGTFSSATAPTLAELDTFGTAMILKFITANIYNSSQWKWLMSYRTFMKLSNMRVGSSDGVFAYPELHNTPPSWKGYPVILSNNIPTNLGGGTDETYIALIDMRYVLFGEEEGLTFRFSDQATIDTTGDGTANVYLFQQNESAILAESMHDVGLRTVKAVVRASGIRF